MSKPAPTVREDDLPIDSSGRVYIDDDIFDVGDRIQAVLITDGGERKHFSAKVISKHRITVPARFRKDYSLDTGDKIDLEVELP